MSVTIIRGVESLGADKTGGTGQSTSKLTSNIQISHSTTRGYTAITRSGLQEASFIHIKNSSGQSHREKIRDYNQAQQYANHISDKIMSRDSSDDLHTAEESHDINRASARERLNED